MTLNDCPSLTAVKTAGARFLRGLKTHGFHAIEVFT
jgi:hypothetical protein